MTTVINQPGEVMSSDNGTALPPNQLPREWTWVNWALALLTAPVAMVVMAFALSAVKGIALCSSLACPDLGPDGAVFDVLYYGAPVIAGLTLFVAFFTATQRRGIAVALCGWVLLLADLAVLAVIF